ncbi:MAG: conserved membrane protein of unknown function [Candidatus Thorarchaeota archaeon]|nr:MAG: conserved membrane protein of unknown function [Candidatus Thorarchaeota archaeon]
MPPKDLIEYHKKGSYPSHKGKVFGLLVVFGLFVAFGAYSLWELWQEYGTQVMTFLNDIGLPDILTASIWYLIGAAVGLIMLSVIMGIAAAAAARRLGGTLIYIGAAFMLIVTWSIPVLMLVSGVSFSALLSSWPVMIPGLVVLFILVLMLTIWKDRVRRAGEIIKLTGQVCLDEKGVFIPPLLAMVFTLVSALLWGAIILQFTPEQVLMGNAELTVENGWPLGVGFILYLFLTIFFYNFAYGTSSAITYIYIRGRDPSLGDGVKASLSVIGGLIVLSIMSVIVAIIRMIIRAISRKSGPGGRAIGSAASGILGWVWMLVNYFTIPSMVAEELSATKGIKRSAGMVRKNFVDVMIKETAVRWGFTVLAIFIFLGFAFGGFVAGYFLSGDIFVGLIFAILAIVFAGIPATLVLRTFDIVYVTLLYVFIRRKEGTVKGKTEIPSSMSKELDSAYQKAQRSG